MEENDRKTETSAQEEHPWQRRDRERKAIVAMPRDDFDRMMCSRFPGIFADRNKPMTETCMCWGFDVGPGWQPILLDLCAKIDLLCRLSGVTVVADQVKEKFATLRFYYHVQGAQPGKGVTDADASVIDDIVQDLVDAAEHETARTCESCGEDGKIHVICGWHTALCMVHAAEHAAKRGVKLPPDPDREPDPGDGGREADDAGKDVAVPPAK